MKKNRALTFKELEKLRKKAAEKEIQKDNTVPIIAIALYSVTIVVIIYEAMYYLFGEEISEKIVLTCIIILFISIIMILRKILFPKDYYKIMREYKDNYRKTILHYCFDSTLTNLNLNVKRYPAQKKLDLKELLLLNHNWSYENDWSNGISGKINNKIIKIFDLCINSWINENVDASQSAVLLDGQIIEIPLDRKIDGTVIIFSKNCYITKNTNGLVSSQVEDIEFNKAFKVYGTKEEDIFYALTPQLISTFKELKNIKEAFYYYKNDKLYIAVDTAGKLIDIPLPNQIKKIAEENTGNDAKRRLKDIIKIIETLSK